MNGDAERDGPRTGLDPKFKQRTFDQTTKEAPRCQACGLRTGETVITTVSGTRIRYCGQCGAVKGTEKPKTSQASDSVARGPGRGGSRDPGPGRIGC